MVKGTGCAATISGRPPDTLPSNAIAFIDESFRGPDPGRNLPPRDHRPATDAWRISSLRGSASATFQYVILTCYREELQSLVLQMQQKA